MRPKIQPNESLRSYIERSIFLSFGHPEKIFSDASKFAMKNRNVRAIADYLGWGGCYGFNWLIHSHTSYPLKALFKSDIADFSYSGTKFELHNNFIENEERRPAFCPSCVKDDMKKYGFSYWRRIPEFINVCATHKITLVVDCPFCGVALSEHGAGRGFRSMWEGCNGRKFSEIDSISISEKDEIKAAMIYEEICLYEYCLPKLLVYDVILKRLVHEMTSSQLQHVSFGFYIDDLKKSSERLQRGKQYKHDGEGISLFIFDCIVLGFESFTDFIAEVRKFGYELHHIKKYMSICRDKTSAPSRYRIGGSRRLR
ncbi:TniQ family protein [Pseudomonas viridiflava]|uniref:TniQ family protein n=1 Tax=Pseudomonas viridiflava TaxID=33069 RepID=UPI000F029F87|nr:TniQ family protein [Pseudomonas viridiflava]